MKTIEEMLRSLARVEVTEFAVVTDRLPCIKVDGAFQPVDDVAPDTDVILQMLVSAGGSRYVDSLGPKPVKWTTHVDGVGLVNVSALIRDEIVQARFIAGKRDPRADADDDGPPLQSQPRPANGAARPDFDPRARGAAMGAPPPPPPAAAAALADREVMFDLEGTNPITIAPGDVAFDLEPVSPAPHTVPDLDLAPPAPARSSSPPARTASSRPGLSAALATFGNLEDLLMFARGSNASDLHIVPERPPLFRIAGELLPNGATLDAAYAERVVMATVPERLLPTLEAEGSCDFALTDVHGRCRVNVAKQRTGYKMCVRLIPSAVPTLASLGLPEQISNATHHHQGLILVTGPTGHGKTSTLAAVVDIINRETSHHVITVEDPVEYVHPRKKAMMSQREVGRHTRSFAAALKGALREDPDVIVVGELRDTETVRMALAASETGHLVIGTMNTPSAAKTIDRVIDLFPPSDQAQVRLALAGGLRLIVSQRLIPNAAHDGLVAACELLPGSISLWSLIRDNKTYQIPSLQQRGKSLGIIRFDDSLADLVKAGRTTLETARQWAESPDEVEMTVRGTRPQMANPQMGSQGGMSTGERAREAVGGLIGKAGNLFRKGQ